MLYLNHHNVISKIMLVIEYRKTLVRNHYHYAIIWNITV